MAKRKRAPAPKTSVSEPNHFQRATTTAACQNDTVSVPDPEPLQPPRRGRGRPRKLRPFSDNSVPNVAASPERRSSRKSEHDADLSAHTRQIPKRESMPRVAREMNTVVKVFCENFEQSSGFIIEGKRVLTNAHLVENCTQIELKKRGSDSKYLAAVLDIWAECDIAMLTVNDEEFWEGVSAVEFGDLPAVLDTINVLGYQIGDYTISVTSGVVSCIEVRSYVHWLPELLGLQIDAAINSGILGGPAFNDKGKCVGITFQSLRHEDVENVGYVVPTLVIMQLIQNHEKNLACTENYHYKASGDRSQGRGQEVSMQDTPHIILAPSESGAPVTCSGGGDDLDALPSPMSGACSATSSIIRKRTRGPTRCLKLAILKSGEKLPVEFESVGGQPVGENARELITYLGVIVRNVANVPLQVKGWKSVPMDMKQKLLDAIQEKFDILDSPFIKKSLLEQMSDRYRNYRHELKVSFYDAYLTDEERLQNPPPDVPLDDWAYLIKYFGSDEYLAKSSRNKANRACNESKHCSGQKSFARVKYDRTKSTGIEPGRISMFKITHQRGDGSFIDKNSEEIMSKIEQLVTEQGKGSSSMDEDEVFTHAAGKDTRRVRGLGRGPTPTVYYGHRHRQNFLVQQTEEAARRAEKACKEAETYKRQAEDAWKKVDKLRNQLQTQIDSFTEEMRRRL